MRNPRGRQKRRSGQATLELALALPFLLLLLMLIIQYSILMNTAVSITNLTREGARYAVVSHASDAEITDRIKQVLPASIKASDIAVTVTPSESDSARNKQGNLLTVSVSYDMKKRLFLPAQFFNFQVSASNFTAQTTMMVQ